jgi:hypothetical protein
LIESDQNFVVFSLLTARQIVFPILEIKIQNGSPYDHTDHCLNSSIVVRCLDRIQPNEIQPGEFSETNANTDPENNGAANSAANVVAETNARGATANKVGAENYTRAASAKSVAYARADRGETDANACASPRRQSLSRSPGRELQR